MTKPGVWVNMKLPINSMQQQLNCIYRELILTEFKLTYPRRISWMLLVVWSKVRQNKNPGQRAPINFFDWQHFTYYCKVLLCHLCPSGEDSAPYTFFSANFIIHPFIVTHHRCEYDYMTSSISLKETAEPRSSLVYS